MHSKKCTVKKYWQMLKYCFCTMIGSCTSCLYMRIEIHSCCPIFAAKRSWKEARLPKTESVVEADYFFLTPPSVRSQMSQHWSCNHCPCWRREDYFKTFSYGSTGPTWAMCSLRCRRWSIHSQACRPRGRPCPCRPSAAAWGCKTPWALHCSAS